jgi:hypothetical protein
VDSDPPQFYLEEMHPRQSDPDPRQGAGDKGNSGPQAFVLSYLQEHGSAPLPAIMSAAACWKSATLRKAVYDLAASGKVIRTNPAEHGKGVPAVYSLSSRIADNGQIG